MTNIHPASPQKPSFTDWHRLFGLALKGDFKDKPFQIETEIDLSIKQQFLDIIILKKSDDAYHGQLPDGFDNLAKRNLISYKSLRETLNGWTLDELVGHYVNYRKQLSPKKSLLPQTEFRLYAICTRFPEKLADKYTLTLHQTGVYEIEWGSQPMRIIVLSRIPPSEPNAVWNLFSNVQQNVAYGAGQYRDKPQTISTVINRLFHFYQLEELHMPYTMEDLERDHFFDVLPMMLKKQESRERILAVMADNLSSLSKDSKTAPTEKTDPLDPSYRKKETPSNTHTGFIKAIGRILRLRFQVDIDRYRSRLEPLSATELDELGELAETAVSLAEFEARLPR